MSLTLPADGKSITMKLEWTDKATQQAVSRRAAAPRRRSRLVVHCRLRAFRGPAPPLPTPLPLLLLAAGPAPTQSPQRTATVTDPLLGAQGRVCISVDNQASLATDDVGQAVSCALGSTGARTSGG